MTAYVALKYGNLDDIVTASERATDLPKMSRYADFRQEISFL